jgi:hypothetical protein
MPWSIELISVLEAIAPVAVAVAVAIMSMPVMVECMEWSMIACPRSDRGLRRS